MLCTFHFSGILFAVTQLRLYLIMLDCRLELQLCVWNIDGWEKRKARPIQAPPGHPSPLVGETKVQFNNDQTHILVVHESQIAIYDIQLECSRSVSLAYCAHCLGVITINHLLVKINPLQLIGLIT